VPSDAGEWSGESVGKLSVADFSADPSLRARGTPLQAGIVIKARSSTGISVTG